MGLFKPPGAISGPYIRKNILPKDMLRPWKRGIAGRVTTGPIKVKVEKPDWEEEVRNWGRVPLPGGSDFIVRLMFD